MTSDAPVLIAPYDPEWPRKFEAERVVVADGIGRWIAGPIEHVGSTAVHGLAAKPVIDIMAGVESLEASLGALPVLERLDSCYAPYAADVMHGCASRPRPCAGITSTWCRSGARSGRSAWRFATTCGRTPTWPRSTPH